MSATRQTPPEALSSQMDMIWNLPDTYVAIPQTKLFLAGGQERSVNS